MSKSRWIARSVLIALVVYGAWMRCADAMGDVSAEALAVSAFKKDAAALRQLRAYANRGDSTAQDWLGAYHQRTGDAARALFWYEKSARQGNVTAQNNLGTLYASGIGTPKNLAQAVYWYRKAAEQGNATAQNNLGILYHEGQGVAQNDKLSADWLSKAANQGNAQAQYNLSELYAQGEGRPRNLVIAYALYLLANAPAPSLGTNRDKPAAPQQQAPGLTEQQVRAAQALAQRMRAQGLLKTLAAEGAASGNPK